MCLTWFQSYVSLKIGMSWLPNKKVVSHVVIWVTFKLCMTNLECKVLIRNVKCFENDITLENEKLF